MANGGGGQPQPPRLGCSPHQPVERSASAHDSHRHRHHHCSNHRRDRHQSMQASPSSRLWDPEPQPARRRHRHVRDHTATWLCRADPRTKQRGRVANVGD